MTRYTCQIPVTLSGTYKGSYFRSERSITIQFDGPDSTTEAADVLGRKLSQVLSLESGDTILDRKAVEQMIQKAIG